MAQTGTEDRGQVWMRLLQRATSAVKETALTELPASWQSRLYVVSVLMSLRPLQQRLVSHPHLSSAQLGIIITIITHFRSEDQVCISTTLARYLLLNMAFSLIYSNAHTLDLYMRLSHCQSQTLHKSNSIVLPVMLG